MMLERQRFAKYSCKDIFRILLACETLVNNQLDLSHSCLLYRENNSWGGEKPLQMFTKCLHTASNLLCTSKHWCCCKIKSYLQQHLSFFRRAIRGVPNITFFGSSEAGSCRKCDFCVRQTDLLKFCCSRKVISGCFRFKQCFPESSVSKPTAKFSDIECCCEDKKAGFVVGLPSGEESSEPGILF